MTLYFAPDELLEDSSESDIENGYSDVPSGADENLKDSGEGDISIDSDIDTEVVSSDVPDYYEQILVDMEVMNELTAKVYCCNVILIALVIFLFVYLLIKNNITKHFT